MTLRDHRLIQQLEILGRHDPDEEMRTMCTRAADHIKELEGIVMDYTVMARNEIDRIKTGQAPGPSMRDCIGQWEATVLRATEALHNESV